MHGWALFFSVLGIIFVAELPDKTALAALVLATRHRPFPVVLGAGSALTVQSLVAVAAGQLIARLPPRPVHLFAGALFLVSALLMALRKEEPEVGKRDGDGQAGSWRSAWMAFLVVFIAEWGDLTQIATGALALRYRSPYVVFAGASTALWAVAALAAIVGHRAGRLLDPRLTKRVAAVVFAVIGGAIVAGAL